MVVGSDWSRLWRLVPLRGATELCGLVSSEAGCWQVAGRGVGLPELVQALRGLAAELVRRWLGGGKREPEVEGV